MREPMDSTGRPIKVGDAVTWRGALYTIKAFGDPTGRCGTRTIVFAEPLRFLDEVPDKIGVDLATPPSPPDEIARSSAPCPWCGDDCPRWGNPFDTCPFRPRQLPR